MSRRYRPNAPHVISEVIDGEAVIIHLGTGDYFSLRGSGSYVWQAIDLGADQAAIGRAYADAGLGDAAAVSAAADGLIDRLLEEQLIVVASDEDAGPDLPVPTAAFEAPDLEKFTDMQDLILLDPVHEVDERGWPNASRQP